MRGKEKEGINMSILEPALMGVVAIGLLPSISSVVLLILAFVLLIG